MAEQGWIKMNRKILAWEWYTDANTFRVFIHLLLKANHADARYRGVEVKRGQVITGREALAGELKMSVKNVRTALEHLKETGEVAITRHAHFSLITINNYNLYQSDVASKTANGWPASGHKQEKIEELIREEESAVAGKDARAWEAAIPERFRGRFPSLEAYLAFESGEEDY